MCVKSKVLHISLSLVDTGGGGVDDCGWQLTRRGTLAHDDGTRESSHQVSAG